MIDTLRPEQLKELQKLLETPKALSNALNKMIAEDVQNKKVLSELNISVDSIDDEVSRLHEIDSETFAYAWTRGDWEYAYYELEERINDGEEEHIKIFYPAFYKIIENRNRFLPAVRS